jgi:hypothetical protein
MTEKYSSPILAVPTKAEYDFAHLGYQTHCPTLAKKIVHPLHLDGGAWFGLY